MLIMTLDWRKYMIWMSEPGFIAVSCNQEGCPYFETFPYLEGKVDLKYLTDWAAWHEDKYHAGN